jgi:para-nitrobenzyl esterase
MVARFGMIALLAGALPFAAFGAKPRSAPMLVTEQGRVAGSSAAGVDRFLGIPFAAPPIGALRWRAPQPAAHWTGVRAATVPSPICMQDSVNNPLTAGYAPVQSEDCLYLNVFRPMGQQAPGLPVMVWIHGGAFIMGSGGMPDYDGSALARRGAIVVTINYRLGRFGSFAHPALSAEQSGQPLANYGLMDQMAALRWVRANARALGGDSGNVTVMGESAGASSVNFLMTSPLARGLFDKAISESGGARAGLAPLATAQRDGERGAAGKGARDLAALRALPATTVLNAPVRAPIFPVIDGRIVLGSTADMFSSGPVARVPYLVGANSHEESLMRWLPGAGPALVASLGARAEPLIAAYTDAGETRDVAVARLWGENAMTLPARTRARQQAARGAAVWLYRFGYVPEARRATVPGAGHGDETPFVFDVPTPRDRATWSKADAAMARRVGDYWVAFARTGNPNHAGAPRWPRLTAQRDAMLQFDADGAHAVATSPDHRLDLLEAATKP